MKRFPTLAPQDPVQDPGEELLRRRRAQSQPAPSEDPNDPGAELLRRRAVAAAPAGPPAPPTARGTSGSWGDEPTYDWGPTAQALRGASLHWSETFRPAIDAALSKAARLGRGAPLATEFRQRKEALNAARTAWEEQHPVGKYGYEIAGGLLPIVATLGAAAPEVAAVEAAPEGAVALTKAARLAKAGTRLAKGAWQASKTGGKFGAVIGAADAEGGPIDYAKKIASDAAAGFVTAPFLHAGFSGLGAAGRAVGVPRLVSYLAEKGADVLPASRVQRALSTLAASTGPKGAAAKQLAPFFGADVGHVPAEIPTDFPSLPIDLQGPAVRSVARDIAAKPTPAGTRITGALGERSKRMRDIVTARLERGVGMTRGAGESFTRGLADDEAARLAANASQQAEYETAVAARRAELARRAAEPEPQAPDPLAEWHGLVGGPTQANVPALRGQVAARSQSAAENFGAARAGSVPAPSPALDVLAETDLGKLAFGFGESQTAQRRAAAEAMGQPGQPRPTPALSVPPATLAPPAAPPAPVAPPTSPARVAPSTVGGIPGASGRTGQALLRDGQALPVEYRIVSRTDVQPSHDPFSFQPNPAYPEGVQGRDYLRNKGIQSAVTRRTFDFSPDIALNPSESLSEGVPTILPNGTVVAGNERAMLLSRVAEHAPERHAAYVNSLKARAADYGIDPAAVDQVPNPMLVRVLADPAETAAGPARWAELNRLSDEVATKGKSSVEEGSARASVLMQHPEALRHLTETLDPESTVTQYLGTAQGKGFVRQLVKDGVIRADELSSHVDASGGLTENGRNAVRRMMLSTAVTRPAVLDDAPAGMLQKIEHAIPSIVSTRGTPYDITPVTTEALAMLGEARDLGFTIHDLVAQQGLFGAETPRSPLATQLATFLETNKAGAVKAAFRKFGVLAKEATEQKAGGIENMFGASSFETIPDMFHASFGVPKEAPPVGLTEHIPVTPAAAPPIAAPPIAPPAPPAPAPPVAQLPTAPAPVRAAAGPLARPPAGSELPPLTVPPGKAPPAPMMGAGAEAWDRALRTMQAAGKEIPWVDAPPAVAADAVPPLVPEPRVYDPETVHYAIQYYAKVAKLGVHDGQGGKLATQAYGATKQWAAARAQLRADPAWAKSYDVFANQSRHIDMTEMGRNLTRTTLDPMGRKALHTSLDAIETRVAQASPTEQEAFRSAAQASIADYFRKGGSRVGLIQRLADPSSQWSRRIALATGDPESPAAFRAALLTPSRPMPAELAPLVAPAEEALPPAAAARQLGYTAPTAKLAPSAKAAAAGRSLPSVEAQIAALPPAEARGAQQGAAARLLGAWEGTGRRVKSPGEFFAKSPERARQVSLAFPAPEEATSFQGFVTAADQAQALNNFVLPTSGSPTQPRQAVAALRALLAGGNPIVDEMLNSYSLGTLPLKAARGYIKTKRAARQQIIDDLLSQWFVTPGAELEQAARAGQVQQQATRLFPRVTGRVGATIANP